MSAMRANVPHSYINEIDKNPNTFVGSKGATDSSSDLNRATQVIQRLRGNERYKLIDIGKGSRSDFTNIPQLRENPGSIYNAHEKNSMKGGLQHRKKFGSQNITTFGSPYVKNDKQVWNGCESNFLGQGLGNLLGPDKLPNEK